MVLRVRRRTDGLSSFGELECEKETWLAAVVSRKGKINLFHLFIFEQNLFHLFMPNPNTIGL